VLRFIDWVLSRPLTVVTLSLLIVGVAGFGAQYLTPKTDYRAYFSEKNPQLVSFNALQDAYTNSDSVVLVLAPEEGSVFTQDTLYLLSWLTEKAWEVPYSIRVDSLANYQYSVGQDDDLLVGELIQDRDALTIEEVRRIENIALNEPQIVGKLLSTSGHVAAVNINLAPPEDEIGALAKVIDAVSELREQAALDHPSVKIYITGVAEVNAATERIVQQDTVTLVPFMFVVVIVVLALLLRSFSATLATIMVVLSSVCIAMGLMGWIGLPLTSVAASAPTIVLTMAVADCVHVLVTYFHNLRHGMSKIEAMRLSIDVNLQPIFLTSLTTAIGFLTMNFSDVPPFNDLGNVVSMGVVAAFILSLTLLPAIMMLLPTKSAVKTESKAVALDGFANFVVKRRIPIFWAMSLFSVILIAFVPQNHINDNFTKFVAKSDESRIASDFTNENLSSFYSMEFSLVSHHDEGIYNIEFLENVDRFVQWLRQQPEVTQVMAITDVFKRLNKNLNANDEAWYKLPDSNELSAQYLLLYEMSLPFGLDLNNQINFDKTSTRVVVNLTEQSSAKMLVLEQKYKDYLQQNMPQIKTLITSTPLMFSHMGMNNASSMFKGTTIALVLISLILIVALRSWKIGLLSIIPNLVPAGLAFGVWGLVVSEVGIAIAIAIGMTLGIVVDNTVHFLSKYLRSIRDQGLNSEEAVKYAFSNVGVALLVTNAVLIAGFLVLAQSSFALNQQLGQFTALTFLLALVIDFLLLPPLLIMTSKAKPAGAS